MALLVLASHLLLPLLLLFLVLLPKLAVDFQAVQLL